MRTINKYHSKKTARTTPSGAVLTFDSRKEAERYDELMLLLQNDKIRGLKLQKSFTLMDGFTDPESGERVKPVIYRADFAYLEENGDGWAQVVEDVKGVRTEAYKIKRKLMLGKYGIKIREI